jgi:biopolymer transport protein ExbD
MLRFKKRPKHHGVQVPMTSLIDIVFLLLIYFLLTTNFIAAEGIKVNLPAARLVAPQLDQEITIHIDASGKIYLQEELVAIPALLNRLREVMVLSNPGSVVVKADRTAIVDTVVTVMDVAKAAGAKKLMLATERAY